MSGFTDIVITASRPRIDISRFGEESMEYAFGATDTTGEVTRAAIAVGVPSLEEPPFLADLLPCVDVLVDRERGWDRGDQVTFEGGEFVCDGTISGADLPPAAEPLFEEVDIRGTRDSHRKTTILRLPWHVCCAWGRARHFDLRAVAATPEEASMLFGPPERMDFEEVHLIIGERCVPWVLTPGQIEQIVAGGGAPC